MSSTNRSAGRLALLVGLVTMVVAPAAAGREFRANVVSWSPADVRPGEPVTVVLTLHAAPTPDAAPPDGRRDVHVVIRGAGDTRRFAATPLGSGRYRGRIVFPETGPWSIWVQYRVGAGVGETLLGKGAVCVA